jgi:hypothetical protein
MNPKKRKRNKYAACDEAVERRRERRRVKFPKPRIMKNDIRKYYANMMTNVMNSFNLEMLASFFFQYCSRDFEYVNVQFPRLFSSSMNSNNLQHMQVKGFDTTFSYWFESVATIPDMITQLNNVEFRVVDTIYLPEQKLLTNEEACFNTNEQEYERVHSHSIVTAYVIMSGQQILQSIEDPSEFVALITKGKEKAYTMQEVTEKYETWSAHQVRSLLQPPLAMKLGGTIQLHINDQHQITKIDGTFDWIVDEKSSG